MGNLGTDDYYKEKNKKNTENLQFLSRDRHQNLLKIPIERVNYLRAHYSCYGY